MLIDIHSVVGKADRVRPVPGSRRRSSAPIRALSPSHEAEQILWISSPTGRESHHPPTHPPQTGTHVVASPHSIGPPSVLIAGWVVGGTRTVFAETAPFQFCWEQKSRWLEMWCDDLSVGCVYRRLSGVATPRINDCILYLFCFLSKRSCYCYWTETISLLFPSMLHWKSPDSLCFNLFYWTVGFILVCMHVSVAYLCF